MWATSEFQLLLTYSTSSRHGGQAKEGFDAPLAQPLATASKLEAGSQRRGRLTERFSQPTRLPLQLFSSCIVIGLR